MDRSDSVIPVGSPTELGSENTSETTAYSPFPSGGDTLQRSFIDFPPCVRIFSKGGVRVDTHPSLESVFK